MIARSATFVVHSAYASGASPVGSGNVVKGNCIWGSGSAGGFRCRLRDVREPQGQPARGQADRRRLPAVLFESVQIYDRLDGSDKRQRHPLRLAHLGPRWQPAMLYAPSSHEPLTERPWDEVGARAAIAEIVAETEGAFDEAELWPAHPRDLEDGPLPAVSSLYLGASGVIWALHELERAGLVDLGRDWAPVAVGLVEHYRAEPDFQDVSEGTSPVAADGRGGDPARRAHACAGAVAGGAAARGGAGERREPLLGAHVGLAGDDDRRAGDGGPNGRRVAGARHGTSRRRACSRSGTAISGSRICTASPRTVSGRPMALRAT